MFSAAPKLDSVRIVHDASTASVARLMRQVDDMQDRLRMAKEPLLR